MLNWPNYLRLSIGRELKLLRDAVNEVDAEGCIRMTQERIVELHKAESKIKYFFMPSNYKEFDYHMAKQMIADGEIKVERWGRGMHGIADHPEQEVDDFDDFDRDNELESCEDEDDARNTEDENEFVQETQKSIEIVRKKKGGNKNLISSINLLKYSALPCVPPYVYHLFRHLPEDDSHALTLQNIQERVKFMFGLLASIARSVRDGDAVCNEVMQNPETAFKRNALTSFRKRHGLTKILQVKGNITTYDVKRSLSSPDKLLPCMILSFLKLDMKSEEVDKAVDKYIKTNVEVFPTTFLLKQLGGNHSRKRWWNVITSQAAFPEATPDDSGNTRSQRALVQTRTINEKLYVRILTQYLMFGSICNDKE